jgi:hypothetical protein
MKALAMLLILSGSAWGAATQEEFERAVESNGTGVTRKNACLLNALDLRPRAEPVQAGTGLEMPAYDVAAFCRGEKTDIHRCMENQYIARDFIVFHLWSRTKRAAHKECLRNSKPEDYYSLQNCLMSYAR